MVGSEESGEALAGVEQHQHRGCACHYPRAEVEYYGIEEEEEEEEEEEDQDQDQEDSRGSSNSTNNNSNTRNGSSIVVSPKHSCRSLLAQRGGNGGGGAVELVFLETIDGEVEEVERDVALLSPLVQREVLRHGRGVTRNLPVVLPKQVSPGALKLILDYCRFHRVSGRSDKERKVFDEKFVRLDTRRLCELTSAADSLDMKPLGDLTSRALARMIEGKTPEQIREIFHLPDDLTEEEKLEPVKISTDDPRIRLLNRLYARKRKELQEKKLLKSCGAMESSTEKQMKDERSVEELVSFIDGNNNNNNSSSNKNNRVGSNKGKRKKNRRKKEPADNIINNTNTINNNIRRGAAQHRILREQYKVFEEEGDFDDDDGLDPALKEIVDREVEDFARRLNSDWLKRTQEILTLASSSQEQRHKEARLQTEDRNHIGNGSYGKSLFSLSKDNRHLQQEKQDS